jgi:hypothetical protein
MGSVSRNIGKLGLIWLSIQNGKLGLNLVFSSKMGTISRNIGKQVGFNLVFSSKMGSISRNIARQVGA